MSQGAVRWVDRLPDAAGIYLLAGLLTVAGAGTVIQQYADTGTLTVLFYVFMDVVVPLVVVCVGVYLGRTDLRRRDVLVVTAWFVGGVVVLWVLYSWALLPDLLEGTPPSEFYPEYVLFGNLGGAVGVVAGLNRARARQNQRLAERTALQQDTLEFVNHLLRHNVLNGLQVIGGYTDMLEDHTDTEGQRLIDRIDERGEHMTELVDNVRVLMRTLSTDVERHPTELSSILDSEVGVARTAYPDAEFEFEAPGEVTVSANRMLGAVFENLLANAVEHNDADTPQVRVDVSADGETATVRVADDGPGIPERYRGAYLEGNGWNPEKTGEGLGLYLVSTLVARFDGEVAIEENDPRGTVVVVRLPLADD
ncbi:sensor histidine kinase [Halorarius halobius]|uniref:sensor histidine kinase n=1 Tax=Halorarius halobius TaxID=2962671 RepID=UPI0020CC6287|nr:HAMP domain-containing sensor histidine kinase [Halorarius halobius]